MNQEVCPKLNIKDGANVDPFYPIFGLANTLVLGSKMNIDAHTTKSDTWVYLYGPENRVDFSLTQAGKVLIATYGHWFAEHDVGFCGATVNGSLYGYSIILIDRDPYLYLWLFAVDLDAGDYSVNMAVRNNTAGNTTGVTHHRPNGITVLKV